MRCSVFNCRSYIKRDKNSSFAFPQKRGLQKKWLKFCGRNSNKIDVRKAKVCAKHFKPEQFVVNNKGNIVSLIARAVPCIKYHEQELASQEHFQPPSCNLFYNNLYRATALNMRTMYPNKGSSTLSYDCYQHKKSFLYVCENCKMLVCRTCVSQSHVMHTFVRINDFVSKGRNIVQLLLESSRKGAKFIENNMNNGFQHIRFIDENCNELVQNIRSTFRPIISALENREQFLLDFVERMHKHRIDVLYGQINALKVAYFGLVDTANMLQHLAENGSQMDNTAIAIKIVDGQNQIHKSAEMFKDNQPQVEYYKFYAPSFPNNILQTISNQGSIELDDAGVKKTSNNYPEAPVDMFSDIRANINKRKLKKKASVSKKPKTTHKNLDVEIVTKPKETRENVNVEIVTKPGVTQGNIDVMIPKTELTRENLNVAVVPIDLRNFSKDLIPGGLGQTNAGIGQAVPGWMEKVKTFRCDVPTLTFVTKGLNDGQASRPWGVCVNKSGHILVTDRRNNNVQVFGADGRFLFKFGEKGKENGEFDAPVGICCDKSGRIIVADKNNHRIQVFSSGGKFILKFGELGSKDGELKFPFGVAVNTNLQIVVADSSNHRIQQFEHNGRFIRQIALGICKSTGYEITPRGVCYTPNGKIILTYYANHCLHLVEAENNKIVSSKGSRGTGKLEFNCPSGIWCDDEGTVIVADSHNQRIKVFNSILESLWSLDVRPSVNCLNMSHFNETDRTCDVALTRDGRIVFVTELLPANEAVAGEKRFVHIF